MDSDLEQQQYRHHFQTQQRSSSSSNTPGGLTRYRSAPSSYLSAFIDTPTANEADYSQPRPLSPETESILARFVQSVADGGGASSSSLLPVKQETDHFSTPTTIYQPSSNKPPLARRTTPNLIPTKKREIIAAPPPPTLARHRSSPAGLFDDVIVLNGLLVSSPKRRKEEEEEEEELIKFPAGNWDELSEQFGGCQNHQQLQQGEVAAAAAKEEEEESRSSSSSGVVVVERMSGGLSLGHHMSLPTAASLEKLMQIDEQGRNTGGCQLRAKRGCATHPRSIAERVRRTKISERMRKLQDLVPNMDNQTNTADMLDLAVHYIKQLETQILTLRNKRARCTCNSSSISPAAQFN